MLKNNNDQDSLLKSRLGGNARPSPPSDLSRLRRREENDGAIPSYTAGGADKRYGEKRSRPENDAPAKKSGGITSRIRRRADEDDLARYNDEADAPDYDEDAEGFDELLDMQARQSDLKGAKTALVIKRVSKVTVCALVALCVYIAFLIYGLIQTNYVYDADGNIQPEVLTSADLRELGQYNELSSYYLRTRILYENVLQLDHELSQDADSSRQIARKYLALLDDVSKLSTDLSAVELDTEYSGIVDQMYELVYTHIAVYLQNMSGAISDNDSDKAAQAVSGREVIKQTFTSLTANMADICANTRGAKNGDIYDWSPDSYMQSLGGDTSEDL